MNINSGFFQVREKGNATFTVTFRTYSLGVHQVSTKQCIELRKKLRNSKISFLPKTGNNKIRY